MNGKNFQRDFKTERGFRRPASSAEPYPYLDNRVDKSKIVLRIVLRLAEVRIFSRAKYSVTSCEVKSLYGGGLMVMAEAFSCFLICGATYSASFS